MVKKIRFKFVVVTMALLITSFIAVFYMNTVYRNYLYRQDVTQYLEFISETGDPPDSENPKIEDEYYTEIYTAVFDKNGKNLGIRALEEDYESDDSISETAQRIYESNRHVGRIKSYVYIVKETENNEKHITFANIHSGRRRSTEILGTIIFISAIFVLFLWVSFFLSKFITDPAMKALEREKQFISDASHELKTPIAAIILNAQAMSGNTAPDSKHLKNILSEAERMNKLIRKLLTLACIDETSSALEKKKFSLSESCEEIILPFESLAFENKIDFSYDIAENIYYSGICDDVKQVISILLDNAFKYTPENGKVKVTLYRKNHSPVFTVYNEGKGISPEAFPHIFDRFYCCEKSRSTHQESFGLGLSIAKAIVNAHGGDIKVYSEFGRYAEFIVIF